MARRAPRDDSSRARYTAERPTPGSPSNGDEPASRHLIQPLKSPIPRLGTTVHQPSGAHRRPPGHARPGPWWTLATLGCADLGTGPT